MRAATEKEKFQTIVNRFLPHHLPCGGVDGTLGFLADRVFGVCSCRVVLRLDRDLWDEVQVWIGSPVHCVICGRSNVHMHDAPVESTEVLDH